MPSSESDAAAIATAFAAHLDHRRYDDARALLAEGCIYERDGSRLKGPESILASYRKNDERATKDLEMKYSSRLESADDELAIVEFIDELRFGEKTHTFKSKQEFTIRGGLIRHILGTENTLDRKRLNVFLAACGIK